MALALLEEEEYDTLFEYIAALWLNCVFTQCSYQAGAFLDISCKKKNLKWSIISQVNVPLMAHKFRSDAVQAKWTYRN